MERRLHRGALISHAEGRLGSGLLDPREMPSVV
jgi:hypothetical protein